MRLMEQPAPRPTAPTATLANAALAGLSLFSSIAIATQLQRPDLDWRLAPISFYLSGPYGVWLQAAYFMLAAALAAVGSAYYRALAPSARSGAPALLFAFAAISLATTAVADSNLPQRDAGLQGWVHGTAAQAAFLFATTAMLLQAWRLRADPGWRRRFVVAFVWAACCFAGVWALAFWRELPRGLAQKTLIAGIVGWLALSAWWLRRPSHPGPD